MTCALITINLYLKSLWTPSQIYGIADTEKCLLYFYFFKYSTNVFRFRTFTHNVFIINEVFPRYTLPTHYNNIEGVWYNMMYNNIHFRRGAHTFIQTALDLIILVLSEISVYSHANAWTYILFWDFWSSKLNWINDDGGLDNVNIVVRCNRCQYFH